jgi:hypothetical protein
MSSPQVTRRQVRIFAPISQALVDQTNKSWHKRILEQIIQPASIKLLEADRSAKFWFSRYWGNKHDSADGLTGEDCDLNWLVKHGKDFASDDYPYTCSFRFRYTLDSTKLVEFESNLFQWITKAGCSLAPNNIEEGFLPYEILNDFGNTTWCPLQQDRMERAELLEDCFFALSKVILSSMNDKSTLDISQLGCAHMLGNIMDYRPEIRARSADAVRLTTNLLKPLEYTEGEQQLTNTQVEITGTIPIQHVQTLFRITL